MRQNVQSQSQVLGRVGPTGGTYAEFTLTRRSYQICIDVVVAHIRPQFWVIRTIVKRQFVRTLVQTN